MIGADTSFLIDFFKGDNDAVEWMGEHSNVLYLCENVVYEFLCGNLTEDERQTFLGFVLQFPVIEFDREAALKASDIYREGKRKGETVPHPDAMIAGTYVSHEVKKIVTCNIDRFDQIDGISVVEYP
ncbi:MAG: PIN domain-containing protein [Halobacteria archaeon]|nr:PIN domain-containing protein [Halobacteria archaeon]